MTDRSETALSGSRSRRAELFPILDSPGAYFDHAAVCPIPKPTADTFRKHVDELLHSGSKEWPAWQKRIASARKVAAELLQVPVERLAFLRNTTEGNNLVARGFGLREGESVVVLAGEFPSNVFPFVAMERHGVVVRRVHRSPGQPIDVDGLLAACDDTTRLVAVSLVAFDDGYRYPVEAIAERTFRRGIFLSVDAIQGLGAMPFDADVRGIDAVTADGHKWLLGSDGAAVAAFSERMLERLEVQQPGWTNVRWTGGGAPKELRYVDGSKRFEGGTPNTAGLLALAESLDLFREIGLPRVEARLREITADLRSRLTAAGHTVVSPAGPSERSGIVSFLPSKRGSSTAVRDALAERNIQLSARSGLLRAAPHFYEDSRDSAALVDALAAIGA